MVVLVYFIMKMAGGNTSSFRAQIIHSHSQWRVRVWFDWKREYMVIPFPTFELMIGGSRLVRQQYVALTLENTISESAL